MANNRMFLVHRPTGFAVLIGKRLAPTRGWYGTPGGLGVSVETLFQKAIDSGKGFDDFAVALESGENQPHAIHDWSYTKATDENGVRPQHLSRTYDRAEVVRVLNRIENDIQRRIGFRAENRFQIAVRKLGHLRDHPLVFRGVATLPECFV